MSATPTADLLAHARGRGVALTRRGAQRLLRRCGPDGARARVEAIGALVDLASAFGLDLGKRPELAAARRLDAAAGSFDNARKMMLAEVERRRRRALHQAWAELEQAYYEKDAHERHAAFLAQLDTGSLGRRATLLLMAARDAGLRRPDAAAHRARLWGLCDVEIARRHELDEQHRTRDELIEALARAAPEDPVERSAWEVDHARYREHVAQAAADERHAREMLEQQLLDDHGDRDLALTINLLADDPRFRGDINRELATIQAALRDALDRPGAGAWKPDPNSYRIHVAVAARDAAQRAGRAIGRQRSVRAGV